MAEYVQCSECKRVVESGHVDKDGACVLCAPPFETPAPVKDVKGK